MKIFITGGSGFIGQRTINYLLDGSSEIELLAVTRSHNIRGLGDTDSRITWARADITNSIEMQRLLGAFKPDVCLHLAWYAEPGKYLTSHKNLLMMQTSLDLIQAAAATGCKRFVAAGTCAEYTNQDRPLLEEDPTAPSNLYSACKLAVCHIGNSLATEHNMAFVWGRVFYLFGPGEDQRRVIPSVTHSLLANQKVPATSGEQVRDFLHVDDVAAAFVALCKNNCEGLYNISSGNPVTMRTLLETTAQIVGTPDKIQFGSRPKNLFDPPYIVGNSQRLQNLGWSPQYSLLEGLREMVTWCRNNQDLGSSSE
jgi:nucleoside-diphosphate-sugar epimerase